MPTPGSALLALRTAVGTSAWATPGLAGKAFGLDVPANPQATYLARLFGVRDVALVAAVKSTSGEARRTAWKIGIACDLFDAAAAALGKRDGSLSTFTAVAGGGVAVIAAGMGFAAMQAGE